MKRAKRYANFRLDETDYERLHNLAAALDCSLVDALRQCLPSPAMLAAFVASRGGGLGLATYGQWVEHWVGRAVRQMMLHDQDYPVDPYFLPEGREGRYYVAYFADWLAARASREPTTPTKVELWPNLGLGDVYLAKPPAGGEWERRGVTRWAVLRKCERFTPDGIERLPEPVPLVRVADMLADLRSPDLATRIRAGLRLATSLGVGLRLAGEHPADVEHLFAPQLSDLLGRAMAGDPSAVDELECVIAATPASGIAEPSAEARELAKRSPGELLDAIGSERDAARRRTLVEAFFVSLGRNFGQRTPDVERLFRLGDKLCEADPEAMDEARALLANMEIRR